MIHSVPAFVPTTMKSAVIFFVCDVIKQIFFSIETDISLMYKINAYVIISNGEDMNNLVLIGNVYFCQVGG